MDFERITVLKVRKLCCDASQKMLRKKLLKHEGVSSVEIQPEKSVVLVTGKADPDSLLNIVARTGKHAVIVFSSVKHSHTTSNMNSQQQHYCCCSCHDHHRSHKIQEDEQQQKHKCENYVPPPFDYGFRPHSWRPAGEFSGHFGQFPRHAGGPPFHHDPRWFGAAPPPDRRRHWPGFYEHDRCFP